jgi:hypothetical protein
MFCVGYSSSRRKKRRSLWLYIDWLTSHFDSAISHELSCRYYFYQHPVARSGCTGWPAQSALRTGGTIANGKVYVKLRTVCGHECAGLFAGCDFDKGDVATLYGGVITAHELASDTHSRCDRGLGKGRFYDGHPHSALFVPSPGSEHL